MSLLQTNRVQNLAGTWKLACDPRNEGKRLNWQEKPPEQDAQPALVPGIIQQAFPDYHGVAWYWTTFRTMLKKNHMSLYALKFHEVDYFAEIWLNGVLLGSHEGAEFPFELSAKDVLKFDGENLLVVRVINPVEEPIDGFVLGDTAHRFKFNKNYMPGTLYNYGGITRSVELIETDPARILDVHAQADLATSSIKVAVNIRNDLEAVVAGRLTATVRLRNSDLVLTRQELTFTAPCGASDHPMKIHIGQPQCWSPEDPQFYLVTVDMECEAKDISCRDQKTVRCGFRELRVDNGYFRLNGKRMLLRCTMTVANYCYGEKIPQEYLSRDLIFAKSAGFNIIRFIDGGAYPEQLDLCDEIGLMVYEESYASWYLSDPRLKSEFSDMSKMPERYDRSMLGLVKRDRNHPSVVIWGLLNETYDGPVFRHAYGILGKLRALDDSRLVLLGSGRWDGIITIGSLSNPGSRAWEPEWGKEIPGGLLATEVDAQGKREVTFVQAGDALGRAEKMVFGDFHKYVRVPFQKQDRDFLRMHAADAKPVFLSEYGVGGLLDVINGLRQYRPADSSVELDNAVLLRKQAELFLADWNRFGMNDVYAFPEDMFADSYGQQARQLRLGFDLVRSNPKFCGSSVLSVEDQNTGSGFWTFWRELKPGMLEALRDGWAPLRWCLFVEPGHVYTGREFELEAVLANEDALKPGTYAAHLRVFGERGIVWKKNIAFCVPQPPVGSDAPLTVNVLRESVKLNVPPGVYEFAATLEQGGAPAGGRRKFYVSAPPVAASNCAVTVLGLGKGAELWLQSHGVTCRPWNDAAPAVPEVIFAGDFSTAGFGVREWCGLMERTARGSTVLFLSPSAFKRGDDATGWLPLVKKGRCYRFHDWVYHKECVAKAHPVFDGLQYKGVMDWEYYDQIIPHCIFEGQDTPDDVAAAAFATGYNSGGLDFKTGYASGLLFAGYRFGKGRFFINTFPLLENLDVNPVADRMLLNIIRHAQNQTAKVLAPLTADLEERLRQIGYLEK